LHCTDPGDTGEVGLVKALPGDPIRPANSGNETRRFPAPHRRMRLYPGEVAAEELRSAGKNSSRWRGVSHGRT